MARSHEASDAGLCIEMYSRSCAMWFSWAKNAAFCTCSVNDSLMVFHQESGPFCVTDQLRRMLFCWVFTQHVWSILHDDTDILDSHCLSVSKECSFTFGLWMVVKCADLCSPCDNKNSKQGSNDPFSKAAYRCCSGTQRLNGFRFDWKLKFFGRIQCCVYNSLVV